MKDIFRNSIIIYIAVPVLVAIWPVLVTALYLPAAHEKLDNDISDYTEADNVMLDILSLAPERTQANDPNKQEKQFAYEQVVPEIASLCSISAEQYKLNAGPPINSKNSRTQSASGVSTDCCANLNPRASYREK